MTNKDTALSETLCPAVRDILRPALLWAVHFTLVYAALSAACAPRGLIEPAVANLFVLVLTVPAAIGALVGARRKGPGPLGRAALWSGVISALAIVFNAAPVLLMNGCG